MAVNFQELLKKPVESAKAPVVKPAGTYTGTIKSFTFGESAKQKTPFCRLTIASVMPGQDVVADSEMMETIQKWTPGVDYYLTENALYRLRELLESCDVAVAGKGFDETIPQLVGKGVIFEVTQRPGESQDGTVTMYNDIGKVAGQKD